MLMQCRRAKKRLALPAWQTAKTCAVIDLGFSNIVAEGLDAGIRLGESLEEHMVAVPITPPLQMAIVGSPEYFKRNGIPETPQELSDVYARLKNVDATVFEEGKTTCCYAKSEKSWISDPQGLAWETFLTTGESTTYGGGSDAAGIWLTSKVSCRWSLSTTALSRSVPNGFSMMMRERSTKSAAPIMLTAASAALGGTDK